jgi:hypothetical protein
VRAARPARARRLILAFALALPAAVVAEPSGAELAVTCARALAQDYRGIDAAACDWYVQPCGVCGVEAVAAEWCLPPAADGAAIAARLVAALGARGDAATRPAGELVREILEAEYPCRSP